MDSVVILGCAYMSLTVQLACCSLNQALQQWHNVYRYILVKLPCECITENIARGCGREPIKHSAAPRALFSRDHAPSAIFSVMHERERYFNWFIVVAFLASAALNELSEVSCPQRCSQGAVARPVSPCDL